MCGGKRTQLFFSVCFAVRMPSQHLEFKWLKRDSQKVWDGINSAALVLKSVLRSYVQTVGSILLMNFNH